MQTRTRQRNRQRTWWKRKRKRKRETTHYWRWSLFSRRKKNNKNFFKDNVALLPSSGTQNDSNHNSTNEWWWKTRNLKTRKTIVFSQESYLLRIKIEKQLWRNDEVLITPYKMLQEAVGWKWEHGFCFSQKTKWSRKVAMKRGGSEHREMERTMIDYVLAKNDKMNRCIYSRTL